MEKTTFAKGDRVYRYVWTGGENYDPQLLTVVRVNRQTVTVETDEGSRFRIELDDLYRWRDR